MNASVQSLILAKPAVELMASYLGFIDEQRSQGEPVWETMVPAAGEDAGAFTNRLARAETTVLPPLVTPTTTYWATLSGTVVGRAALRHALTPDLAELGGHISYEVRPSRRRQGIATELLRQLLLTPKAKEIGTLLLTCAPTNIGSNKTIQANGGQLLKTSFVERIQRDTSYYRIEPSPELR